MMSGSLRPAAQFDAYAAIARESAGAGEHQVAQAGEPGHGFLAAAAGHSQARDLSQAAGDESGNGIVAESQPVAHAGRDGDYVFQRAAEFHSDHIVVGVEPEAGIAEFALHRFRQLGILRGHGDGGRIAASHFLGERRSAQRCDARRKPTSRPDDLRGHFSHPQKRGLFQPFGCAHEEHRRA